MWTPDQRTKIINCKRCGKEIVMKGRREYCIPCRRELDKEIAKNYREKKRLEKGGI